LINLPNYGVPIELGNERMLRPGKLLWLRSVLWAVGLTFLLVLSFGPLSEALKGSAPATDLPRQFVMQTLGAAVAMAVYVILVRLVEHRRPSELAMKPMLPELLVGLLLGLVLFGAVMAILTATGGYQTQLVGLPPAWRAAGQAIEAGIVEELIIRGVILRLLWRAFGPTVAFAVSAALFGAGHLPNPDSSLFAAFCIALEAGIMFGAFYAFTGRLWVPIGVHAAWNFTQGYIFGAAVSGGDLGPAVAKSTPVAGYPEWLTGGAFGPEASLPALVVCTFAGVAALFAAWRTGRLRSPTLTANATLAIGQENRAALPSPA
jgi:hypothetical protein